MEENILPHRLHSVRPGKRPSHENENPSIEEEALAGPDGPLPRKLTPEWIAVNLMDITAHLMAAIDKAAGPLDRLADAAEDATAHVVHLGTFLKRPVVIVAAVVLLIGATIATYEMLGRLEGTTHFQAAINPSEISLGGVTYPFSRKLFDERVSHAQPESIHKYFVEIGGRNFPVKQAVSVGFEAPRASFSSEAAIHALTRLGYITRETSN
ncbi:MAG TPA: hypothetical protein VN867_06175 [Candidatus Binataceae bacterium]|nr:hypothetical protein [Candidatus Binataceae bacterium]